MYFNLLTGCNFIRNLLLIYRWPSMIFVYRMAALQALCLPSPHRMCHKAGLEKAPFFFSFETFQLSVQMISFVRALACCPSCPPPPLNRREGINWPSGLHRIPPSALLAGYGFGRDTHKGGPYTNAGKGILKAIHLEAPQCSFTSLLLTDTGTPAVPAPSSFYSSLSTDFPPS